MESIEIVTKVISTVGFPTFMCLLLLYRMDKQAEMYKENEEKLRDVINSNTMILKELCLKIGGNSNG